MRTTRPKVLRWSRREYDQMTRIGLFEGKRVELIHGIIYKKDRQSPQHAYCVHAIARILENAFGDNYWVRQQLQLRLLKNSDPEPDIAVARGSTYEDFKNHPSAAELVIEISHTDRDLAFCRSGKAALYAKAGIEDYWIVNLMSFQLEVLRGVKNCGDVKCDYSNRFILLPNEMVSPLRAPKAKIAVADLLPP